MTRPEPTFHAGEQALQRTAGIAERMAEIGPRVIRDYMPDQHRELFEELPMLFLGSLDAQGRPWASVLTGAAGFVRSPDAHTLHIAAQLSERDPLRAQLTQDSGVGVLGIQLETRRRNRANGRVTHHDDSTLTVHIEQSFGNCPKYIHPREPHFTHGPAAVSWEGATREQSLLSAPALELVHQADTFMIASASSAAPGLGAGQGVDVSHRGGPVGFVRSATVGEATQLTVPDYVGNFFFNTLGNLVVYPHAGLLFLDFARGALLSLTVDAELVLDGDEVARYQGAQRLTRFSVRDGWLVPDALPMRFRARG